MASLSYVPLSDNDKAVWLGNFAAKLATHAPTLGISAAEVTSAQKDAAMCMYIVTMQVYKRYGTLSVTKDCC